MSRIRYVNIGTWPLDHTKMYTLVTRGYMARGKDGFDSLLVKSEGGVAEEIVSEENGILISMLLRQYFMSLKILGQWKMWGKSMARHWGGVHQTLHESHPIVEPQSLPLSEEAKVAQKAEDEDDDISADESEHSKKMTEEEERKTHLMRKVTKKWRRLAGLHGQSDCCDNMRDEEFEVDWTRVSSHLLL